MDELERNQDFLDAGIDLSALADIDPSTRTAVLERLGPAHFRSKGFSFMGFLQTVYDHVAQQASQMPTSTGATEVPGDALAGGTDVLPEESVVALEDLFEEPPPLRTDEPENALQMHEPVDETGDTLSKEISEDERVSGNENDML
jgi:hypothetical protein